MPHSVVKPCISFHFSICAFDSFITNEVSLYIRMRFHELWLIQNPVWGIFVVHQHVVHQQSTIVWESKAAFHGRWLLSDFELSTTVKTGMWNWNYFMQTYTGGTIVPCRTWPVCCHCCVIRGVVIIIFITSLSQVFPDTRGHTLCYTGSRNHCLILFIFFIPMQSGTHMHGHD